MAPAVVHIDVLDISGAVSGESHDQCDAASIIPIGCVLSLGHRSGVAGLFIRFVSDDAAALFSVTEASRRKAHCSIPQIEL
jgi:hypothetical protein